MTNQEAIAYLRPIADSTPLPGYGQAPEAALKALEMVEVLRRELQDERYRHDRYLDYSRGQDQVIDRLKQELEAEKTYREFYEDLVQKMQERFAGGTQDDGSTEGSCDRPVSGEYAGQRSGTPHPMCKKQCGIPHRADQGADGT